MLAIPVFRARVAPVLDWCSKMIIVAKEGADASSGRQIDVTKEHIFELMRTLREQGITTLICGALSLEVLNFGESMGLRIIHGIAGEVEEVLRAYREGRLERPEFRLPGCCGRRRYKGGARCTGRGTNRSAGAGESGGSGASPVRKEAGPLSRDKETGGPAAGTCFFRMAGPDCLAHHLLRTIVGLEVSTGPPGRLGVLNAPRTPGNGRSHTMTAHEVKY